MTSSTHHSYFTNGWLMPTTSLSDESAIIWFVWWWIGEDILCGPCSPPPSHPHTLRLVSPVPLPPRGWLTFDGWQADGSRCRRGTSSAWFHSASPPPSSLVNKIKCWSSIEEVTVYKWLLMLRLSLTHEHNALLFIWFSSLFSQAGTLYTPVFTFDFFGEFDPVWVGEWARLLVYVVDVQHFTHELNDWLGLIKGCGRHCKIKQGHGSFKMVTTTWYTITPDEITTTWFCNPLAAVTSQFSLDYIADRKSVV